jgi:hypothetical protein
VSETRDFFTGRSEDQKARTRGDFLGSPRLRRARAENLADPGWRQRETPKILGSIF